MRGLSIPRPPSPASGFNSQAAVIERLAGAGIRADAITAAIALLRSGRADLIAAVIDGALTVERALRVAQRGRR